MKVFKIKMITEQCIDMKVLSSQDEEIAERCVVCGEKTEYTKNVPIDERTGYVKGAGQLCRKCCFDIYSNNSKHKTEFLSEE